jgi:hypothetical protein
MQILNIVFPVNCHASVPIIDGINIAIKYPIILNISSANL